MKQQFGSDIDSKVVSNAAKIESQSVICGYWLLNEVTGWLRKVEKNWEVHGQGIIPAFGGWTWENDKIQDCRWSNQVSNWGQLFR